MMLSKLHQNEKGLGLIETIAALGVAVVVITALVSLSVFTLRSSTKGKLLQRGSKLASNELELVRAYRDRQDSWETFVLAVQGCSQASPCHMEIAGTSLSVGPNELVYDKDTAVETGVLFYVTDPINVDGVSTADPVLRITVQTRWKISGQDNFSFIYTDISNWRTQ